MGKLKFMAKPKNNRDGETIPIADKDQEKALPVLADVFLYDHANGLSPVAWRLQTGKIIDPDVCHSFSFIHFFIFL